MNEKPLTGYPNKLAEGEMEQIERDIKSREHDEKVYYTRFMFAFLGILLLVMLVAWECGECWERESIGRDTL